MRAGHGDLAGARIVLGRTRLLDRARPRLRSGRSSRPSHPRIWTRTKTSRSSGSPPQGHRGWSRTPDLSLPSPCGGLQPGDDLVERLSTSPPGGSTPPPSATPDRAALLDSRTTGRSRGARPRRGRADGRSPPASGKPFGQDPTPSFQAASIVFRAARPASKEVGPFPLTERATTSFAPGMLSSSYTCSATFWRSSALSTTRNRHGCLLLAFPASRPASRIRSTTSVGSSVSAYLRTSRRLAIASQVSIPGNATG